MNLPINSVKQLYDTSKDGKEIAEMISKGIGEVESVIDYTNYYKNIVVGEIVEAKPHPDADKLGVYQIKYGKKDSIQVVAGDRELKVGDKVAYLQVGCTVPSSIFSDEEPFVLKQIKLRGIESNGMLGSQRELNLGSDHSRVMVLPSDAPVGEDFAKYFELDDTVISIENKALTNRGDLFGVIGLSRELAAMEGKTLNTPDWFNQDSLEISPKNVCLQLEINNDAESLCRRYMAVCMNNIEIKESPVWIKSFLIKSGLRPINNVVDITNYLMLLTGQPLHAFDFDKLVKNDSSADEVAHIVIRMAKDGEKIKTLTGDVVELGDRNMVIADSNNPVALAGIMGGSDTEIDESTKNIVIECANFDKYNIRKTSMSLGLFTDASTRFTRSQDPNLCLPVLRKAVDLIESISGGTVASNLVDIYPDPLVSTEITISVDRLNKHLGLELTAEEIVDILHNLEYEVSPEENIEQYLTAKAPTWRKDIRIAEDIHEDIARIYGLDKIPTELPLKKVSASKNNDMLELKKEIRHILSTSGFNELTTYNFCGKENFEKSLLELEKAYVIKNALSPELQYMRTTLTQVLLEKAQENIQKGHSTFGIYEQDLSHRVGELDENELPLENWFLSSIFVDVSNQMHGNPYYESKRYLEKVFEILKIKDIEYVLISDESEKDMPIWLKNLIPLYERSAGAVVKKGKVYLGIVGEINNQVKINFKLPKYSSGFEINLESILNLNKEKLIYIERSNFPSMSQDLCFVVQEDTQYKQLYDLIDRGLNKKDVNLDIECIDIYKSEKEKKITLRITVESKEKTLKDKDFEKMREKLGVLAKRELKASLL